MRSYLSALGTCDMKDTQPPLHKLWNALFVLGTHIFIWMTSKDPSYLKALSVQPQVNPSWMIMCCGHVWTSRVQVWVWSHPAQVGLTHGHILTSDAWSAHDMSRHTPCQSQGAHDTRTLAAPVMLSRHVTPPPCLRHAESHSRGHSIADTQHPSLEQSYNVLQSQAVIGPTVKSTANVPRMSPLKTGCPTSQSGFQILDQDYHQLTNVSPVWPLFWVRWRLNLDSA